MSLVELAENLYVHRDNVFYLVKLDQDNVGAVKSKQEAISAINSIVKRIIKECKSEGTKIFIEQVSDTKYEIYSQDNTGFMSYVVSPSLALLHTVTCEPVGILTTSTCTSVTQEI